jgi:hypothetical protein
MINNTSRAQTLTLISLFLFLLPQYFSATASSWIHEVRDAGSHRVSQLRLRTVAEEDNHVVGSMTYDEVGHNVALDIKGVRTPDGRFWPHVVLEAANDWKGPWKRLDQSDVPGGAATITVRFGEANSFLYVRLDCFRPIMANMRYGRIILPNNGEVPFELSELLPAKATNISTEDEWRLNIEMGYLSNPIAKGPFFVGGIVFKDGHLHAEAGYLDLEATSVTVIDGTSTPNELSMEEDFWASATLQVSNDPKGEWQTVGQAPTPGKPATLIIHPEDKRIKALNIGVDSLRPMIGKFGYGRAMLKNGKAAAFELINLLPPQARR